MIEVKDLTIKYPSGKGVFDLDFKVAEGEVMGYLGPNGAGKTTTIRGLMGFMHPTNGICSIGGLDCWAKAPLIQKSLGYIPGEIAFIESMNGEEYLRYIAEVRGIKDTKQRNELINMFEFSPKGSIKKFSKGMKQKLGIVAAFMHDPKVLILDEPTSGLDPLMQNRFVELILSEKKKGKTILMSSHMFEEIERTCDNVLIIKDGHIMAHSDINTLKNTQRKCFILRTPDTGKALQLLNASGLNAQESSGNLEIHITGDYIDKFTKVLGQFTVTGLDVKVQTLEDVFMHFYSKEVN